MIAGFYPKVYDFLKLDRISILALNLNKKRYKFLSFIPGVDLDGSWFVEQYSEAKGFRNAWDTTKFIFGRLLEFLFFGFTFFVLILRIVYLFAGSPIDKEPMQLYYSFSTAEEDNIAVLLKKTLV